MSKRFWAFALGAVALVASALALRVRQVARRAQAQAAAAASGELSAPPPSTFEVAEAAYDGKLGDGWSDWGWGQHDLPGSGPARIVLADYGGIVLHHSELGGSFGGVSFRYKAPQGWSDFLSVGLKRAGSVDGLFQQVAVTAAHLTPLSDGWQRVFVPWADLNPTNLTIDRVTISARTMVGPDWVLLDKIVFTKPGKGAKARAPVRNADLKISCENSTHPIDPGIYGAAGGDWESGQTGERIGGNLSSRLNWDANFWNTGNDWFFENYKVNGSIWDWLDADGRRGTPAAVTVPMIGWVAKDDHSVGFPRAKFPKQRKFDEARPEAGDGYTPQDKPIRPGTPEATSSPAPPQLIGHWIHTLREKDRARGARSASMYILDNEPSLWSSTHRDVHPDPLSEDELMDRTLRYATEIRKADPEGLIAGPAEWGWRGYQFSGVDQASENGDRPDRRAHGDLPLIPWYLRKLADYERTNHVRLLDVLDVHFYPAAEGMYGAKPRVDASGAELRIRSTRALWDTGYRDESWINEPIALIPRLKKWVLDNYPGRKVSLGEWSFGAETHISGGIATAEALGRFGQQGLDSAFFWMGPKVGTPTFWAFRAYRNFDGKGGRFLDISVPTYDSDNVSLFASRDDSRKHLVAIIVNRDASFAVNAHIGMPACGRVLSRRVYSYGQGSTELTESEADENDPNARVLVEPYSFAVVDLRVEPR